MARLSASILVVLFLFVLFALAFVAVSVLDMVRAYSPQFVVHLIPLADEYYVAAGFALDAADDIDENLADHPAVDRAWNVAAELVDFAVADSHDNRAADFAADFEPDFLAEFPIGLHLDISLAVALAVVLNPPWTSFWFHRYALFRRH